MLKNVSPNYFSIRNRASDQREHSTEQKKKHRHVVMRTNNILQRRGERRATINEEMGGVYDVNVLYRGYVQLTSTKNSKTNVYSFVLHRARLKSIMHPWRPTW